MKKLLSILCAVCVICFGVSFAGCSGGEPNYSETFEGALSEQSYADKNQAAEGFLNEELSGGAGKARLVSYEKQADMTEEQISGLNIQSLEQTETVVAAEVVNLTYKTVQSGLLPFAEGQDEEQDYAVFTVYILEISREGTTLHEFRYYVPRSELGQSLTSSYFKDLLDPAKYTNYTESMVSASTFTGGISANKNSLLKVDVNKAYLETQEKYNYPSNGYYWQGNVPKGNHLVAYLEESENDTYIWASLDGGETFQKSTTSQVDLAGITDIESMVSYFLPDLDYSFYEKTDYGFKIKEKYLNRYLALSLGTLAGGDATVNAQLEFYVVEGRLYKILATASAEYSSGGSRVYTDQRQEYSFTDFGSTVVEKPAKIEN